MIRVVILLAAAASCAGCWPALVVGAAAGAYAVGKDEREPAQIAVDGRITTAVKSRLIADKYVDGFQVGVATYEGVVTLEGTVTNSIAREQAERLAASVEGVKSVNNQIQIVRKKPG
jgi:osmotically-inducible protein OsmY